MNLTPEIAVLHSALKFVHEMRRDQHAACTCGASLAPSTNEVHNSERCTSILREAIGDCLAGLTEDLRPFERKHLEWKITVILLSLVLREEFQNLRSQNDVLQSQTQCEEAASSAVEQPIACNQRPVSEDFSAKYSPGPGALFDTRPSDEMLAKLLAIERCGLGAGPPQKEPFLPFAFLKRFPPVDIQLVFQVIEECRLPLFDVVIRLHPRAACRVLLRIFHLLKTQTAGPTGTPLGLQHTLHKYLLTSDQAPWTLCELLRLKDVSPLPEYVPDSAQPCLTACLIRGMCVDAHVMSESSSMEEPLVYHQDAWLHDVMRLRSVSKSDLQTGKVRMSTYGNTIGIALSEAHPAIQPASMATYEPNSDLFQAESERLLLHLLSKPSIVSDLKDYMVSKADPSLRKSFYRSCVDVLEKIQAGAIDVPACQSLKILMQAVQDKSKKHPVESLQVSPLEPYEVILLSSYHPNNLSQCYQILRNRQEGYRDCFQLLLEADMNSVEFNEWFEHIKEASYLIGTPEHLKCLLSRLNQVQGLTPQNVDAKAGGKHYEILKGLVLDKFMKLPQFWQNELIAYHYEHYVTTQNFSIFGQETYFRQSLVATLNKITGRKKLDSQNFSGLASLLLKEPLLVLDEIFKMCLQDYGIVLPLTWALRNYPSISKFARRRASVPYLCELLQQAIINPNLAEQQRVNLGQFAYRIVLPFKSAVTSYMEGPILDPGQFCTVCLLPQLASEDPTIVGTVLYLLHVIFPKSKKPSHPCLLCHIQATPLIFCLLQLHDRLLHWSDIRNETRVRLQTACVAHLDLLSVLASSRAHLVSHQLSDAECTWLYKMAKPFHWTIRLQLWLFPEIINATRPLYIPKSCSSFFQGPVVQDVEFTTTESGCSAISAFLQLAFANDRSLNVALGAGGDFSCLYHPRVVLEISKLLPGMLLPQCKMLLQLIWKLIEMKRLVVSFSAAFISPETPALPKGGSLRLLTIPQLFTESVFLRCKLFDKKSMNHVLKCYCCIIKAFVDRLSVTESISCHSGSLEFLLCQTFCHVCSLLSMIPAQGEQSALLVLALDILNSYKLATNDKSVSDASALASRESKDCQLNTMRLILQNLSGNYERAMLLKTLSRK